MYEDQEWIWIHNATSNFSMLRAESYVVHSQKIWKKCCLFFLLFAEFLIFNFRLNVFFRKFTKPNFSKKLGMAIILAMKFTKFKNSCCFAKWTRIEVNNTFTQQRGRWKFYYIKACLIFNAISFIRSTFYCHNSVAR